MVRGTTAHFKFNLPYDYSTLSVIKITFWQPENDGPTSSRPLPIVKVLSQCTVTPNVPTELNVSLNQEETLRFSDQRKAYVQLRGKTIDGHSFASKQEELTVYPVYDDSILDDNIIPTPTPGGGSGEIDDWIILDGSTII